MVIKNAELLQSRLDLLNNILILESLKTKKSNLFFKKESHINFVTQKEICHSLIEAVHELNAKTVFAKNTNHNETSSDIIICISTLKHNANKLMHSIRTLSSLNPEINPEYHSEKLFNLDISRDIEKLLYSKKDKCDIINDHEVFLRNFCVNIRDIIVRLDNIYESAYYYFDINFAEYYVDVLSKNLKKEKEFYNDVIKMKELYKEIYKIIEQLERYGAEQAS